MRRHVVECGEPAFAELLPAASLVKFDDFDQARIIKIGDRWIVERQVAVFADADAMKEKIRSQLSKPLYDVRNFYHDTGRAQEIARSSIFENVTLAVLLDTIIFP